MKPVRGIETTTCTPFATTNIVIFPINETRSRDWNRTYSMEMPLDEFDFPINETRSRDWNSAEFGVCSRKRDFPINETRSRDWNNTIYWA